MGHFYHVWAKHEQLQLLQIHGVETPSQPRETIKETYTLKHVWAEFVNSMCSIFVSPLEYVCAHICSYLSSLRRSHECYANCGHCL